MFVFYTLVYLLFTYTMYVQANKSYSLSLTRGYEANWDKYLWYFVIIFTMIGGFRYNVGADSYAYALGFKYPENNMELFLKNKEYLWYALLWLHRNLGLHYVFGMCAAAFLQIYFLARAAKEYRYLLICLPIALFGSKYFGDMMNGVRQLIAAAIFVYASRAITDKNLIRYLLLITLASFFHHSAIMLYPLYLIAYVPQKFYDIAKFRLICLCIFFICFVIGESPQLGAYISFFSDIALFSGYEDYSTLATQFADGGIEDKYNFGLIHASWLLTSVFTIYFAPQLKAEYNEKIPYFNIWYLFSFLYACLYFLVHNVGIALLRPIMHFEYYHLFIISLLLYYFYSQRSFQKYKLLFIMYFVIIWASKVWDIIKGVPMYPREITIYKLFFFYDIHM